MCHVDPLLGNDARGVASWGKGARNYIPCFEGSHAVPARPPGRGYECDSN
jgi:hypothetical protein